MEQITKRNNDLYKMFKKSYDVERKRYDDVIKELAEKFYLKEQTVNKIIMKLQRSK